jgi:hypothetical protein
MNGGNHAAETLDRLRRNDPSETKVDIRLRDFTDDALLSEYLQANDHIDHIRLCLDGFGNANSNWELLLRVLATRENLERVDLLDDDGVAQNSPERITPFLVAIQQNPIIQFVLLECLQLSGGLVAAFIDTATSVATLELGFCHFGAIPVAAILQRNTNIQRLDFYELDEMCLILIVNSLAFNTSVKELEFRLDFPSLALSLAVGSLLESTKTIQRFKLIRSVVQVDTFRPIAQGLIQCASVTDVKFSWCRFDSQDEVLLLNSILESKSNLQSLTLVSCSVHQDGRRSLRSAIFNVLQPHSLLRSLVLYDYQSHLSLSCYGLDTAQDFNRLLTAVERSALKRFSIGRIVSREECLALIASIPRMQVGALEFSFQGNLRDMKGDILGAIKRNASLRTIVANNFDEGDRIKLNSYSSRNKFLAEWMENPNVMSKTAWPEALVAAQPSGPDTVFRILRVLAPFLGPPCRKRRRPDFYVPS